MEMHAWMRGCEDVTIKSEGDHDEDRPQVGGIHRVAARRVHNGVLPNRAGPRCSTTPKGVSLWQNGRGSARPAALPLGSAPLAKASVAGMPAVEAQRRAASLPLSLTCVRSGSRAVVKRF